MGFCVGFLRPLPFTSCLGSPICLRSVDIYKGGLTCRRDLAIKKIQLVNLLEEPVHEIEVKSTTFAGETVHDVQLCFRGFEIKTVRVCLERRRKEKERRGSSGSWVKV